jgi:hypothetical protein
LESFYRKFIRNFSIICAPILDIVKKKHISFNWIAKAKKLKEKITEQLILVLPDFKKTFHVRCDVSGVAIGAILSQGNMHVAYLSEQLKDAKRKYSTYDKEFYVVIQGLEKWRH